MCRLYVESRLWLVVFCFKFNHRYVIVGGYMLQKVVDDRLAGATVVAFQHPHSFCYLLTLPCFHHVADGGTVFGSPFASKYMGFTDIFILDWFVIQKFCLNLQPQNHIK